MRSLRAYIRKLIVEATEAPQVIFMAGGPGSGKSTVIRTLGLANRLEVINPDDAYEAALRAEGVPLDRKSLLDEYKPLKDRYFSAVDSGDDALAQSLEPEYLRLRALLSRNMQLFAGARRDARARQEELLASGGEFLVDGTGGNSKEILKMSGRLKEAGFEVGMIFIDVPMETSVARDRSRGERGGRHLGRQTVERSWNSVNKNKELYQNYFAENFFYIDASEGEFENSIQSAAPAVRRFLGNV